MATDTMAPRRERWLNVVNVPGLVLVVGLLALWQLVVATGMVSLTFLPPPTAIAEAFSELIASGQLLRDVSHTLSAALLGWLLGSGVGLILGTWLGVSIRSWRWGMASVDFLRSIPAITFVPVAALLLGFSLQMELMVTTYAALWPVVVSTIEGARKVSPLHLEVASTLHLSPRKTVLRVILPGAAASIVVGLRLALALALTLAVASEMVGNPRGVGYALILQQQALQPAAMFAYIITVGVLGLLLNWLLMVLVRVLMPGVYATLKEDD
jgi:ABC-type nitrate/sulfonate/bicarbonate transport system permease component